MEPRRAVADLELFLADRGDRLLRTAILLTGSTRASALTPAVPHTLLSGPAEG